MPESEHYIAVLGSDPAEIARVRSDVREIAIRHGFADRAGDLTLALDELIANAQEHGRAPVAVHAWVDGRLVIEVRDVGDGFDRERVWETHPPAPERLRGRGLWIARQLADHIETTNDPETGTIVRIEASPDPHIGA